MILRHMYALERAERYRARRLGFRFTGFVSEATEDELFDAVEGWWAVEFNPTRDAQHTQHTQERRAFEQRLQRCLGAIVDAVFRLGAGNGAGNGTAHGADELNLSAADWRHSVGDALLMNGEIIAGGDADNWLDQVNARTADGLHHVTLRTSGRLRPADYDSDDSDDSHDSDDAPDRRVLRVFYGGPQRFRTYDTLNVPAFAGGRVEEVLVLD
jgi:hypothetical protein